MRTFGWIALCAGLALALPASAEIYRWTDASGRVHFTQELSEVPREHRTEAVRRTLDEEPTGVSTFSNAPEPGAPPAARSPRRSPQPASARGPDGKRIYRVRVERAGTSMLVAARINNGLMVPFLVDTGASDVSIPQWAAERLSLENTGRTREYMTANGVIEEPVVMLRSVNLGGAQIEDVPASISTTMNVGLLGLSFFNRFTYHVDAANGILTLMPNDLEETGKIRGGRSEAQWRAEYRGLHHRMDRLEAEVQRTGTNQSSKLRGLEEAREELEEQYETLEAEADQARVPMAWRE